MKSIIFLSILFFLSLASNAQNNGQEWHKLFNGTDLSGWEVPENNQWWTIHDGILKGSNDQNLKGSILWTKKKYGNFIITLDFKYGEGIVDSGVFLRSINEQIQLGISGKYKRDMTCSPYIGSKSDYPVEAKGIKELLKPKDWNSLKIEANGSVYTVWLNGKQVLNYNSDTAIEKGPIGLQVHPKKEMTIEFRNILCAELQ
jgi:hypothetical protein